MEEQKCKFGLDGKRAKKIHSDFFQIFLRTDITEEAYRSVPDDPTDKQIVASHWPTKLYVRPHPPLPHLDALKD